MGQARCLFHVRVYAKGMKIARENEERLHVRLYNGGVGAFTGLRTTLPSSRATKRGADGEGNTAKPSPLFLSYRNDDDRDKRKQGAVCGEALYFSGTPPAIPLLK